MGRWWKPDCRVPYFTTSKLSGLFRSRVKPSANQVKLPAAVVLQAPFFRLPSLPTRVDSKTAKTSREPGAS